MQELYKYRFYFIGQFGYCWIISPKNIPSLCIYSNNWCRCHSVLFANPYQESCPVCTGRVWDTDPETKLTFPINKIENVLSRASSKWRYTSLTRDPDAYHKIWRH